MATYSTFAEAEAAYLANLDWADSGGDTTKAEAFRSAIIALQHFVPQMATEGKVSSTFNVTALENRLREVSAFLNAEDHCGVDYADLSEGRL